MTRFRHVLKLELQGPCLMGLYIPAIIPLVSVLLSCDPNTISARPTRMSPTMTVNIPTHMCFLITRPRKATDNRAVNMMTAPKI